MRNLFKFHFIILLFLFLSFAGNTLAQIQKKTYTLNECVNLALENSHKIKASKENINIASAQLKQAQSGYYPQLSLNANYTFMDQDPLFIMPSFNMSMPPLPVPGLTLGDITIPQQDIKMMDRQNIHTGMQLLYPFYTGGKVGSINRQAEYGYEISKNESRKTDLEVKFDVKRYYYSLALSEKLYSLGEETLQRLNATLSLTESLYKNGSGSVTKIDYLKNKIIVDQVSTVVIELKRNLETCRAALLFTVAGNMPADFEIADKELSFDSFNLNFEDILEAAYKDNPDWLKVNSALEIYKAKIDEAQSGYLPSLALFANVDLNFNSYDYGIVNKDNKTMFTVGVGLEMPLFSGFRTKGEVEESEAKLKQVEENKLFLKDAIVLQLKEAFLKVNATKAQAEKMFEAKQTAGENSSLTERAFQQDMVKADDLVQAQIMEALAQAQYYKALFDYIEAQIKLDLITGK